MRKFVRRSLAVAGAAVFATTALWTTASPASAATYNGACGDGYAVINSYDLSSDRGTIFLTYNNSNGHNCVTTVRTVAGTTTLVEAMVRVSGSSDWVIDSGDYTTYAGPVHVEAAGKCIDWGGTIGTETRTFPNQHCG